MGSLPCPGARQEAACEKWFMVRCGVHLVYACLERSYTKRMSAWARPHFKGNALPFMKMMQTDHAVVLERNGCGQNYRKTMILHLMQVGAGPIERPSDDDDDDSDDVDLMRM